MLIERNIDLEEALVNNIDDGKHLYLLIEGAGSTPIARERLFYESSELKYTPIYANTDYTSIIKVSPLLVSLCLDNDFLIGSLKKDWNYGQV